MFVARRCSRSWFHSISKSSIGCSHLILLIQTELHSLPSAHTAVAFGLAMALASFYPKAARWFWTLAVLVAFNRVHGCAHYLSDVFWGAAIGITTAYLCLESRRLVDWLGRAPFIGTGDSASAAGKAA